MIRMNEMTWMEFKAKIDEGAITILPIGACEQHGPHLPLCVDTVLANGFAERLAQRVGGMVAPAINYVINLNLFPAAAPCSRELLI